MKEKIKIEVIGDFLGRGHLIFYVDAGIIDESEIEDLLNDVKMMVELRRKRNNNDRN